MTYFFKIITLLVFCVFIAGELPCYSAAKIQNLSCTSPSAVPNWPRNVFIAACSANITGVAKNDNLSLGIYTSNYNTTKVAGNGSTIDYRQPESPIYRFRVIGPLQGGLPANITTLATRTSVTMVANNITTNATVDFDILYTTYEADYGGTQYSQPFNVGLYSTGSLPINIKNSSLSFVIENRSDVSVSGPLIVQMTPDKVFTFNNTFESNPVTVTVKSNNIWKLQVNLLNDLIFEGNILPVSSNYFQASGTGFTNLSSSPVQFVLTNTYYDAAQSSTGVYRTGTTDNINLNPLNMILKYSFKNTALFKSGLYASDTVFNLVSPY